MTMRLKIDTRTLAQVTAKSVHHVYHSLNSLKGGLDRGLCRTIGAMKGDTRSLDNGSCCERPTVAGLVQSQIYNSRQTGPCILDMRIANIARLPQTSLNISPQPKPEVKIVGWALCLECPWL